MHAVKHFYDQGDEHILALLVLQYFGSFLGTHAALCLELGAQEFTLQLFELLVTKQLLKAAQQQASCIAVLLYTLHTERKLFLYSSALSSCLLSYSKSGLFRGSTRKLAVTLQWSKHHPLWTSTQ